jgi:membrane-associated phospholipid phosphatase
MNDQQKTFILPSKENLKIFGKWSIVAWIAFTVVYGLCNHYASGQTELLNMYTGWELEIPLVPQMILVYLTLNILFVMVLFVLKTADSFRGLVFSILCTLGIAGVIFVIFPGHLGYERPDHVSAFAGLFKGMYEIDKPHNLFPSLHVTFSFLCIWAMIHQTSNRIFHIFMKLWFIAICASVILVHQHHIFDVVSGLALAAFGYKYVYLRVAERLMATKKEGTFASVIINTASDN